MLDAKERLIRENFKSELTNIKRIKTIYDKPTGKIPLAISSNKKLSFNRRQKLGKPKVRNTSWSDQREQNI